MRITRCIPPIAWAHPPDLATVPTGTGERVGLSFGTNESHAVERIGATDRPGRRIALGGDEGARVLQ